MNLRDRLRSAAAGFMGYVPAIFGGGFDYSFSDGLAYTTDAEKYLKAYRGWIFGCVRIIASTAAAGRVRFYTDSKTGGREYLPPDHPLEQLMRRPNEAMTRWQLWYLTLSWLELTGKAYWLKVRDGLGVVRMLMPLQPDWIQIVPSETEIIAGYIYSRGGKRIAFEKKDLVYLRYPDPADMRNGAGPLQAASYSYDSDLAMHRYDKKLFDNGASVKGILQTDQYVSKDDAEMLRKEWKRIYGGVENAKGIAVLHSGLKYTPVELTPAELDFAEGRRFTRQEIFAIFGVSEGLLGMVEDVNKTNNVQLMDSFLRFTMAPKAAMIREQIDADLADEVDIRIQTEFELPRAVDALQEHQLMEYRLKNYVTSINEERSARDMEPAAWGDTPWMPFSNVQAGQTVSSAGGASSSTKSRMVREISEESKDLIWRSFLTVHAPQEKSWERTMWGCFKGQRTEVQANLKRLVKMLGASRRDYDPALIDAILFSLDEWNKKLAAEIDRPLREAILAAAEKALLDLAMDLEFNITDPLVQEFITNKKFILPPQINQLTHDKLREVLATGFRENKPVNEIAEMIDQFFDNQDPVRALRIARTEVTGASNFGIISSYRQTGIVKARSWITARDERVRLSHVHAEDESLANPVPLDQPFIVGGRSMMYPGDPNGGASEIMNCRCTTSVTELYQ
ncbi:MAG: phage portal protein [Caldisericales bacterium]|nr:phage portal protein [Caldisericales bacterium]